MFQVMFWVFLFLRLAGSEPTVWDGDYRMLTLILVHGCVPSPPCGMVTLLLWKKQPPTLMSSEPTVWDGDSSLTFLHLLKVFSFRAHCVGWRLSYGDLYR